MNIEFDCKEFEKQVASIRGKIPKIAKKMIAAVFGPMRSEVRKRVSSMFNKRTGRLRSSINYFAFDDWSGAITTKQKARGNSAWHASFLENGAVINAQDGKHLTFKVNGEWKKVKSVVLPPRPFMKPVFESYFGGGGEKAKSLMDKKLQSEIEKLMGGSNDAGKL
jgi:hypothetical protein